MSATTNQFDHVMILSMVRTKVKNSLSIQEKGLEPRLHLKEKLTKRQRFPSDFTCGIVKVVTLFWFQIVDIADILIFVDIQLYAVDPDCSIIQPNDDGFVDVLHHVYCSFPENSFAFHLPITVHGMISPSPEIWTEQT